ncbi:MAG: hypothetical protein ACD_33C00008G0007 [uncultured bacterium]|nr:MAG: hypothetical protein ACD_33C00008G0007 [uncultured bacterium]
MKFLFLDYETYMSLDNKDINVDILMNKDIKEIEKKLSPLTLYFISTLNLKICKLLQLSVHNNISEKIVFAGTNINKIEREYIDYKLHTILNEDSKMIIHSKELNENVYFMKTLPNEVVLVVFRSGFVKYLMETKDNFSKFILECLHLLFKLNLDISEFMKLYLTVSNKNIDLNYFKLRV